MTEPEDMDISKNIDNMEERLDIADKLMVEGKLEEGVKLYKEIADFYLNKGENARAVFTYKRILSHKPEDIDTLLSLGIIYKNLGHFEEAKNFFRLLLRYDLKNIEGLIQFGLICKELQEIDSAILSIEKALELKPDHGEGRKNLGDLYIAKNKIPEAIREYYSAAEIYTRLKDNQKAREICEIIKGLEPEHFKANLLLKELTSFVKKDDRPGVKDEFYLLPEELNIENMGALMSSLADIHKHLGVAYTREERYGDAIAELQEALRLAPDDIRIYEQLGEIFYKQGRDEQSIKWFLRSAELYIENNEIQDAIRVYKNILKITPSDVDIMGKISDLYFKANMIDEFTKITIRLGDIYVDQGILDKAMLLYEGFLEHIPSDRDLRDRLIYIYKNILEIAPKNNNIRYKLIDNLLFMKCIEDAISRYIELIEHYLEKKYYKEAISTCDEILKHRPDSIEAWIYKGTVWREQGNYEMAIKCFNNALEIDQAHPVAREKRDKTLKEWSGAI